MSVRVAVVVVTVTLTLGCGAPPEPESPPREVTEYTIDEFLSSASFSGLSFSPDNATILVSSNQTGILNAYAFPVDGGLPVQLTSSTTNAIRALSYFPNDERFVFTSDEGGNELNHVFVRELDGSTIDLTPGEGLKASFAGWASDDRSLFIQTNERDQRFFDLYEYDDGDYSRELIFQNDDGYFVGPVSSDRRHVALVKLRTSADSDIYLYDRESDTATLITAHDGDVVNAPQMFTPDGQSLYYLTDADSEFRYLVRYEIGDGTRAPVVRVDWDVLYGVLSKHGTYLVVGINTDARTELRMYEHASMTPVELPALADATITSVRLTADEHRMAFYASSSRTPRDLFVYDLSGGEARQITRSLNERIEADDLVEGQVVRFTSYDGVEIPGILYKPHHASETNKVPALVSVHGGPGGQSRVGYSSRTQYLVNHGYAVFAINNRGSTGYGKTFSRMDDRKHGDADLDDCVASIRMLIDTGWIDPHRIGIIGGSYGGYMVLAALTFRPDAFAVGVDYFGISNWYRTVNSIPSWWEAQRDALEQEMGDFDDEEFFIAKSPLFHADNIVRPLIVLQGANDPRVLQVESDQIVEAVRANGVPVEYVLFDDEGHGFVKKDNQAEASRRVLAFIDRHLTTVDAP